MVAIGGLFTALPSSLAVPGPRWFFPAMVRVLLAPTIISHHTDHRLLNQILGYILNGAAMIAALALLITALTAHTLTPRQLLQSAARSGSATFWSLLPGTAVWTPVSRMSGPERPVIPMVRFFSHR